MIPQLEIMIANFERTVRACALTIAIIDSEVDSVGGNFHI